LQGSLSAAYGLADAVKGIYVGRRSGILAVERSEVRKRLYFEKGSFTFSDTSEADWRLGQIAVRLGTIEQADLDRVLTLLSPDKRIGKVMTELGLITAEGLNEVVQYQITENVYPMFAWTEGEFDFEEKENAVPSDIAFPYSSANLIMEGVRRIVDHELIRGAVGGLEQVVSLGDNPLLRFQSIFLQPKEGFILSRIDGALSIDEVCSISPVPEEQVLTCLYGLKSTGILEFRTPDDGSDAVEVEGHIAGFFSDFAGVERFLGEGTAATAASSSAAARSRAEMDEIRGLADRLRSLDHYGVLGVDPDAETVAIRKAYYGLAKKYHPDRHHKSHLTDLQDQVERIFVRINEAYEILKDEAARGVYDQQQAAGSDAGAVPPLEAASPEQQAARREQMSREAFADGKQKLETGDLFAAIRSFRLAIHNQADVSQYRSYLGRTLAKNPKWRKEAEEHLLKAIELEPRSAEHYAELGELYRGAGLGAKAERYYAEALKRDAGNRVALAGRKSLTHDKKGGASLGGTFRSLFDRKK